MSVAWVRVAIAPNEATAVPWREELEQGASQPSSCHR